VLKRWQGDLSHPLEPLKDMGPNYQMKKLMRWSMDHLAPPNVLYDLSLGNPVFQRIAQVLFFTTEDCSSPKYGRKYCE